MESPQTRRVSPQQPAPPAVTAWKAEPPASSLTEATSSRRRFGQHFPGVSALRIHLDTLGSRLLTCLPAEGPGGSDFGGSEGDACLEPSRCVGAALRAPVELQVCSAPSVFLRPGSPPRVPAQGPASAPGRTHESGSRGACAARRLAAPPRPRVFSVSLSCGRSGADQGGAVDLQRPSPTLLRPRS